MKCLQIIEIATNKDEKKFDITGKSESYIDKLEMVLEWHLNWDLYRIAFVEKDDLQLNKILCLQGAKEKRNGGVKMIKCTICENHQHDGAKHTCSKCKTKTIYGEIHEQFIECCSCFKMIEAEKKRQAYYKKLNSLPIDNSGGKNKRKTYMNVHSKKNN